jgi:hypothetical protein
VQKMIKRKTKRYRREMKNRGCIEIENETAREKKGRVEPYDSDQDG